MSLLTGNVKARPAASARLTTSSPERNDDSVTILNASSNVIIIVSVFIHLFSFPYQFQRFGTKRNDYRFSCYIFLFIHLTARDVSKKVIAGIDGDFVAQGDGTMSSMTP